MLAHVQVEHAAVHVALVLAEQPARFERLPHFLHELGKKQALEPTGHGRGCMWICRLGLMQQAARHLVERRGAHRHWSESIHDNLAQLMTSSACSAPACLSS